MAFEKIGPCKLRLGDAVLASLAISFLIGAKSTRLSAAISPLIGSAIIIFGIYTHEYVLIGVGILLFIVQILITPALRALRKDEGFYIESSPDRLVVETSKMRATLKWPMIRKVRKIGSRLFIMISSKSALVISDSVTGSDNMDRLIATIEAHR